MHREWPSHGSPAQLARLKLPSFSVRLDTGGFRPIRHQGLSEGA
ncbi:hypothetical protein C4K40_0364 [Pseudomonas sp. CMR5c]|nr:hypothetical protein C4K40_0364 [Pseudomonas sp. CMR5c]